MKRTKWELAGICAGIVGIFGLSMLVMPELSAADRKSDAVVPYNAAILEELPSNRVSTIYINGTMIDEAGLAMLRELKTAEETPGPGQQFVDMTLLAAENRAVTYSGIVAMKDGKGSGGYSVVCTTRPDTMAVYEQYSKDAFNGALEVKKLNQDSFAYYLPDLPYEFDAARKSDISMAPDEVACMIDAQGQRRIGVRLVDGNYQVTLWVSMPAPAQNNLKAFLVSALTNNATDAEAVADYVDRYVQIKILADTGRQVEVELIMQVNAQLIALLKPMLAGKPSGEAQGPAPEVVSTSPANGATGVDPATTEISVRFSRPMRKNSYSFCQKGNDFPEVLGLPLYDAAGTTVTMQVKLKPDTTYNIYLNLDQFQNFVAIDGAVLKDYHYTFTTGSGQ